MRLLLFSTVVLLVATPALSQRSLNLQGGWHADLDQLTAEIAHRHPNPFANVEKDVWESAVSDLDSRLDGMSRNEFAVELQRLVAILGDAHTSVNPQFDPAQSVRRYPVELYLFEDGLHVRRAPERLSSILGGKVVRIGNADSGKAFGAVASTISTENTWWIRASAPERLVIPEVMEGLGLVNHADSLLLTVEKAGQRSTVTIQPEAMEEFGGHGHGAGLDKSGWVDMRGAIDAPLWLQNPHDTMWYAWLEDIETLYVCYRAVVSPPSGPTNGEFWDDVFATVDRENPKRLVLDIRENSGGNGMLNRNVIQQLVRRPHIDRSDRLFVIIGRNTFSAGQQLANELDWWTQATFVGEPTGQSVSQYGDADRVVLEQSGISAFISTRFHQGPNPLDTRDFVAPDIYAPLTSAAYAAGIDPAMESILANEGRTSAIARIAGYLQAGQLEAAERLLVNATMDPANRYRNFEREMNAIGYDLLGQGLNEAAVAVFQINTRVYPASANAFDSLGEALARSGRTEEAIEAYRRALEIDPEISSSIHALQQLEGHSQGE